MSALVSSERVERVERVGVHGPEDWFQLVKLEGNGTVGSHGNLMS